MPRVTIQVLRGSLGIYGKIFQEGTTNEIDVDDETFKALNAFDDNGTISVIERGPSQTLILPVDEIGRPFMLFSNTIEDGRDIARDETNTSFEFINNGSTDDDSTLGSITHEPTGFPNRVDSLINITTANNITTFTIFPADISFDYYMHGVKYVVTTVKSVEIPDVTGLWFIYFNGSTLTASQTFPGMFVPLVSFCYWNAITKKSLLSDERHGISMDGDTHGFLHQTVGTRYGSGLTGTFTDTTLHITNGDIWDEDIRIDILDQTQCRILYKNGSTNWEYDDAIGSTYFKLNGSLVRYNNGNVLADVASNNYVAYWIFGTNDTTKPIISIMGQRVDTTIANARLNNKYESLSFGSLPYTEMKLLYRVIIRGNQTYQETQDLRSVSNLPSGTYVATDHNTLTNIGVISHSEIDSKLATINSTPVVNISDNYTLPGDIINKLLYSTGVTNITITLPTNSSVPITTNTEIGVVRGGTGTVTFLGDTGVTVLSSDAKKSINKQYEVATLKKLSTDTWLLYGSLI